jgi:hypothetical protein
MLGLYLFHLERRLTAEPFQDRMSINFCRGPLGIDRPEPGQDRNVAALRVLAMPGDHLRLFTPI